ncbi:ATP-binding protein [Flavisolibacter tropicus]|uniref:Serine/threonine protein kinase n=1 Tax=Flavisolibacter tropicus TaxID=1492898 RepID=A0A172TUW0_9BACT|nr:ATP-binding protein [Flavisolibacter tropicus]ANE50758.1 serine/threonine protein kinase [Flavisolibacter tropicus]
MDNEQLLFTVADRSYFALLKKDIHALAIKMGFNSERAGKVDIVVAELVSNLVKHANGGHLLVKQIKDNLGGEGIELVSMDNGGGIHDLKRMLQDGISTTNTLGHGLGSIQRLSDKCEIYTQKDWGTVILSRLYKDAVINPIKPASKVEISTVVIPKPGEEVCGDGVYYKLTKDKLKLFVGDGLGHGPNAAKAINDASHVFKNSVEDSPVDVIREIHQSVRKTRGLVASVAIFNFKEKVWRICGVGNIAVKVQSFLNSKNYVSHNGIIGHNIPNTMKDQLVPYEPNQTLLFCSDGIKTRWELYKYPGILKNDLSVLTAALYKDHTRNTDDASVVAVKINL